MEVVTYMDKYKGEEYLNFYVHYKIKQTPKKVKTSSHIKMI